MAVSGIYSGLSGKVKMWWGQREYKQAILIMCLGDGSVPLIDFFMTFTLLLEIIFCLRSQLKLIN